MNLSLIDPFILAQDYPESLTGKLSKFLSIQLIFYIKLTITKDLDTRLAFGLIAKEIFSHLAG